MPSTIQDPSGKKPKRRRCKCCKCSAVLNMPTDPTVKKFQCSQCGALLQVSPPPTAPALPARRGAAALSKPRRLKLPYGDEPMSAERAAAEGCPPPRLYNYLARFGVEEDVYVAPTTRQSAGRRRRRRRKRGSRTLTLHMRYPSVDHPSTERGDAAFPPESTMLGIAEIVREIMRTDDATRAALSSAGAQLFDKPSCFSLVTNDGAGQRRYVACFVLGYAAAEVAPPPPPPTAAADGAPEDAEPELGTTLHCELEVICLFSHWPFVTAHEAVLAHFAALATQMRCDDGINLVPGGFERAVSEIVGRSVLPGGEGGVLTLSVPHAPLAGGSSPGDLSTPLLLPCQRPPAGTLPTVDSTCFSVLFRHVRPRSIVQMLGLALQGQSLLLISSDVSRLVPAAEALRALLFPLQWGAPLVFAPVLSPTMLRTISCTDAPYIGGVTSSCLAEVGMMERNPTIVKVDNGTMIPPIEAMDRLPPLPDRLAKQLEAALQRACETTPIDVPAIRVACLRAIAKLLGRLFAVDPTEARAQNLSERRYEEGVGAPFSTATALQPSRCRRSYRPFVESVLEHSLLWSRYLDEYSGCTPISGERLAALQFFEEFTMHEREVSRLRRESMSAAAAAAALQGRGGTSAPKPPALKLPGPSPRQLLFRFQSRSIGSVELSKPAAMASWPELALLLARGSRCALPQLAWNAVRDALA